MTQEEKNLLLRDICGRLSYGVKCQIDYDNEEDTDLGIERYCDDRIVSVCIETEEIGLYEASEYFYPNEIKPYLRPMSSMTENEREEIEVFIFNEWYQENSCKIDKEGWIEILANYDVSGIDPCFCSDYIDWLNAHHFDYRGLIPMGLALEAPEGMYKTE